MSTLDKDLLALVAMFKKDEPADPTVNMSPEDAAKWKAMNEEHGDKFKTAATFKFRVHTGPVGVDDIAKTLKSKGIDAHAGTEHVYGTIQAEDEFEAADQMNKASGWGANKLVPDREIHKVFKTAAYGDPYWMAAKYPGKAQDGTPVKKGDKVFYYPRTKTMLVGPKAEAAAREFGAMSFDEDFGYRSAGFSVELEDAWYAFVGNAAFNKDTIEAINRVNDIPFTDDEGTLHDEGGSALKVMRNEYSGPLTYAQEKAGQVRETVVQVRFVKGMDKKKILKALQDIGKKFKLKVEPMTGYKKPATRGKKAAEMSDLAFLASLDMELTASALPGVGLDKDAAALESLAKLAMLDRTADAMIGRTILDQMGGARRLQGMLGVKNFILLNDGVAFAWPSKQPTKGNYLEVRLNGSDLYDVKFFNVRGMNKKLVKAFDDIGSESLVSTFERQTGWYLRMASDQAHQLVRVHAAGTKGPDPKGRDWKKAASNSWSWHDRATGILFTVQEDEGPGIPIYTLRVFHPSHGMFKHIKPFQWKNSEGAFQAAAWEYPKWTGQFANNDLTEHWSKVTTTKDAGDDGQTAMFEKDVSADPTVNMSPEDAAEWKKNTEEHKDDFKTAGFGDSLVAEGCPDNLDESECKEWEANTEQYGDKFKTAGTVVKSIKPENIRVVNSPIIGTIDVDGTVVEVVRSPNGALTTRGKGGKKVSPAASSAAVAIFKEEFPKTTWGRKKEGSEDGVMAEGCPDNLDEGECAEWEANTEKYKDVVKDQARTAAKTVPIEEAKKGDLVEVTYKGEKVTGKVVLVKKDGLVTVDVEKTKSNPGGHSDEDVSHIDIRVKKTAYEEGSRVPDGWDNGHIEGEPDTDVPGDEGSEIPDGNGNQHKRAGKKPTAAEKAEAEKLFKKWREDAQGAEMDDLDESWENFLAGDLSLKDLKKNPPTKEASVKEAGETIAEMYALVSDDGYMLGATDDWHDARSKSYWRPFVDEDHVAEGKLMTLVNVPLNLAEKFKDMGTNAQWYSDGYEAWTAARRFVKGPGTKLASAEKEAASGLYGHTKRIQADCEGCVRKVQKSASDIARNVYARNAQVAEFLATHSRRADSLPAKILVAALQGLGPKVASEMAAVETRESRLAELRIKQASSKSPAHEALLTRLASVSEVPLATIQGIHMAKLLSAAEDLKKQGFVTFDGVTVAKVTDADSQTGEGIKSVTDKNASGSGAANAKYLNSLDPPAKAKILQSVAKHYGVTVPKIEAELTDSDAEALYEYLAFDHSLAVQVLRHFQKVRLLASDKTASGVCLEAPAVALLKRISQTAYSDDMRSMFERELGIPTHLFSEHLMALDMAKMISLQKGTGPKGKSIMVNRITSEGLKYLADAKVGKNAARTYGLYGFGEKVAKLGLQACADLRHEAGKTAHDLHTRRAAHHASINDFFANHSKTAKCMYSKLLSASYPEMAAAKTASLPNSVQGWLEWDRG